MANERIAAGEIFIGLDDEAARLGLEKIERDFARAMQRIEHEEATVELRATYDRLRDDLRKAEAETRKYQKYVKDADTTHTANARKRSLERVQQQEKEARAAVTAHKKIMDATDKVSQAEARQGAKREAEFRREQQRQRLADQVARKQIANLKKQETAISSLRKEAERENASRDRAGLLAARQERDVAKLNRRYSEATARVREYRKELDSIRTPRDRRVKIELNEAEAVAEMKLIQAELGAMGRKPIEQKIALDVHDEGIGALERWTKAITDTTVRVGPFTTTIAGLTRTLLLLGPVVSGLVGQFSALVAVVGGGVVGAMGVGTGAIGAFGVSLGGVGLLLPSLLRDFKNLNTLQDAYHKQVLKTGANSDKAKTKLQEFNHALGEVTPTTRHAFDAYDKLQDRWRKLRTAARPDFLAALGSGIDTVNKHFEWFGNNTLQAFHNIRVGWDQWMKGLRGGEATRILHTLGQEGNRSIAPLMSAFGHLAAVAGRVAAEFSRFLPGLLHGFDDWAASIDNASTHSETLHKRAQLLVSAMQSVGRFTMAAARVIMAFFLPGVDDGTNMVNKWAAGLNRLADNMQGKGRKGIDQWFKDSIVTANKFWQALKPLAQLFFEWSNIMRPFTNVAIDALKVIGDILQVLLDFGPTKDVLKVAFGVFLFGALMKRIGAVREGLAGILGIVKGLSAAGGIGGVLKAGKGGVIKFLTGGMANRGSTPANPLFVVNVGPGGGPGGIAGKIPGGGGGTVAGGGGGTGVLGGLLRTLPRLVKFGGGVGALAAGMWELNRVVEKLDEKRGLATQDKRLQSLVSQRNLRGLYNMRDAVTNWAQGGKGNSDKFVRGIDNAIAAVHRLDQQDINRLSSSMDKDYKHMGRQSNVTLSRISGLAKYHFNLIARTTKKGSFAAQQAASHNFNLAADAIHAAMKRSGHITQKGLDLIEKLWEQALATYGFSKRQAKNIRAGLSPTGGAPEGTAGIGAGGKTRAGPKARKARGGLMQVGRPGEVGPDSVPMNLGGVPSVVAPGEQIAVFNRHQQKKFARTYPGGLSGFFSGPQRPHHYDAGGLVGAANRLDSQHFPYRWGGGHEATPAPLEPVDCSGAVSYVLQHGGINIPTMTSGAMMNIGKPGPGPITIFANPEHVLMRIGQRFFGTSASNPGGGAGWIDQAPPASYLARFTQRHFDMADIGTAFSTDIKAPMVEGLGVLGQTVQAALDVAAGAASQNVQAMSDSFLGGGDTNNDFGGAAGSKQVREWVIAGMRAAGYPVTPGGISALVSRAMQESTGNPNAVNNWDINAQRGDPSKGLMQLTGTNWRKYHVPGTSGSVFDPVANVAAAIRYMMATYGHLVGATGRGYAMGGLVDVMGPEAWARGGMVNRPTMLTGEDGGKHPEFVISTNPMFKSSNLDTLSAAASALGIPQARKGHNAKKHKKKKTGKSALVGFLGSEVPTLAKGAGKDIGSLRNVKHYADLQTREDDTNRQISINASKVQEPDTFLKQTGTDEAGNPVYAIDNKVIATYQAQLQAVLKLWDRMLGKGGIMDQLQSAAAKAYTDIYTYINRRYANIDALNNTISIDKMLARSKDAKTRDKAQNRLQKAKDMRSTEYQKIGSARDMRKQIQDDQHDAYFRRQEYAVDRGSVVEDKAAVGGRAADELQQSRPTTDDTTTTTDTGPTVLEQTATLSTARSELYQSMGSNFAPIMGAVAGAMGVGSPLAARTFVAAPSAGTSAVSQSSRAVGVFNGTSPMTTSSGSAIGAANQTAVTTSSTTGNIGGSSTGLATGNSIVVENVNFPVAPTDPHTFSRNLVWELGALST